MKKEYEMTKDKAMQQAMEQPVQEPWGACVSGRVFVGALPEHVRKLTEDDGLPIQLLYTAPQRKPLTDEQIKVIHFDLCNTVGSDYKTVARAIEAAHNIKEQL